jgi:putative transposase
LLSEHDIASSMSRPGNCYDNAVAESFFGTLKTELVNRTRYRTREEARSSLFAWIECWYNRRRRHSSLGYLSPEAFEAQLN